MSYRSKPRSIVINSRTLDRNYGTFKEWQTKQSLDERTPEERGIRVGSAVMWRHMVNNVIVTDRGTVLEIDGNTLTLQIKDSEIRTGNANIQEIVSSTEDRLGLTSNALDKRASGGSAASSPPDESLPIDAVS